MTMQGEYDSQHSAEWNPANELEIIERDLISKLDGYRVGRIIDNDRDRQTEFFNAYQDKFFREDENLSIRSEAGNAIECVLTYKAELVFQARLVKSVAALVLLANHPENGITDEELTQLKKQQQAEMVVHHGMRLGSSWQQFIDNETSDIDGLDLNDDADLVHIQEAEATLQDFWLEKNQKYQEVRDACELAGASLMDVDSAAYMAGIVTGMQEIAEGMSLLSRDGIYQELCVFGSEKEVSERYGKKTLIALVEFFADKY